nr:unnamed protein product [Digitaria exilis]
MQLLCTTAKQLIRKWRVLIKADKQELDNDCTRAAEDRGEPRNACTSLTFGSFSKNMLPQAESLRHPGWLLTCGSLVCLSRCFANPSPRHLSRRPGHPRVSRAAMAPSSSRSPILNPRVVARGVIRTHPTVRRQHLPSTVLFSSPPQEQGHRKSETLLGGQQRGSSSMARAPAEGRPWSRRPPWRRRPGQPDLASWGPDPTSPGADLSTLQGKDDEAGLPLRGGIDIVYEI